MLQDGIPFSKFRPHLLNNVHGALPARVPNPRTNDEVSLKTLWIRRLPWTLSRDEIQAALRVAAPEALEVTLPPPKGKARGKAFGADHRGHAFITFQTEEQAEASAEALRREDPFKHESGITTGNAGIGVQTTGI